MASVSDCSGAFGPRHHWKVRLKAGGRTLFNRLANSDSRTVTSQSELPMPPVRLIESTIGTLAAGSIVTRFVLLTQSTTGPDKS